MRIAIPCETDEGPASIRSEHFGHAKYFNILTVEDGQVVDAECIPNVDHDTFGCGGVISFAMSLGIDAIIVAGMGKPPYMRFSMAGIAVYLDTETPYAGEVLAKFVAGKCERMLSDDACTHH